MFRDPKVMGPVLTILRVIPAMYFFKHNLRLLDELDAKQQRAAEY